MRRAETHVRSRDDAQVTRRGRLAGDGPLDDLDGVGERGASLDPRRALGTNTKSAIREQGARKGARKGARQGRERGRRSQFSR